MPAFARIIHADWSMTPAKRWAAVATYGADGWTADAPRPVGSMMAFVGDLFSGPQPTLAGFDFPIGLPAEYGRRTGLPGFAEAMAVFGRGEWAQFFDVAERADQISVRRPFYPRAPGGKSQAHLLTALDAPNIDALRRRCERATSDRRAACSLFWTLGGNQVGKAAIAGWRELIGPACSKGARLWPFEGDLATLAEAGNPVLAETYPAEAYGHIGVRFKAGGSKTRQEDRRDATAGLFAACEARNISLTPSMSRGIADGFGPRREGEDAFDAAMGLFGMIEVVEGRRPEGVPADNGVRDWEGWIMGQKP